MKHERFFPTGAIKIRPKTADCVLGLYEKQDGEKQFFGFIAYSGKRNKHDLFVRYRTREQRDQGAARYIEQRTVAARQQEQMRQNRILKSNPVKIGDVFYTSWGYDQTNVEFYQVTAVKGQFVWVREICKNIEESGFMSGHTTPVKNTFRESAGELKKRVLTTDGGKTVHLKISDLRTAWQWDGRAKYVSWYA